MKPIHHSPRVTVWFALGLLPGSLQAGSITAHPADARYTTNTAGSAVIAGPDALTQSQIFIGGEYYTRSLNHYVVPFQLPDLGAGAFSDVSVSFTTHGGSNPPSGIPVNLFALPGARAFASTLPTDVNANGQNHAQLGTVIKSNFLNASTVHGSQVSTGAGEAAALSAWLNSAYAAGSNAGSVVFMRLSPAGVAASSVPFYGDENGFTADAGFNIRTNNSAGDGPVLNYTFTPQSQAAPEIASFSSNRSTTSLGGSVTLSWTVSGATSLTLNPGGIDVTGLSSLVVTPSSTTAYTLTATHEGNSRTSPEVTVNVRSIAVRSTSSANASSGSTQVTVEKPAGTSLGDVLIATISRNANHLNPLPTPTGWRVIDQRLIRDPGNANKIWGGVYYRVADGNEGANFTFGLGGNVGTTSTSNGASVAVTAFSGVDTTSGVRDDGSAGGPFDVDPGTINAATSATTTATAMGLTTTRANVAIVMPGMIGGDRFDWTEWKTTSSASLSRIVQSNRTGSCAAIAWALKPAAGATGNGTAKVVSSYTANSQFPGAILLAMREASNPVVQSFTVSSSSVEIGAPVTLSWSVLDADSVSISSGVGTVAATGSVQVYPTASTNYTLTATNASGPANAAASVTIVSPGPFRHYRMTVLQPRALIVPSDPEYRSVFLSEFQFTKDGIWIPAAAVSAPGSSEENNAHLIQDGVLDEDSNWEDTPPDGGDFRPVYFDMGTDSANWNVNGYRFGTGRFEVTDMTGWRVDGSHDLVNWQPIDLQTDYPTSLVRHVMSPIFPISFAPKITFEASPSVVAAGESVTLKWNAVGATASSIDQSIGTVAAAGSQSVTPSAASTTYTLTASNGSFGTRTASVTVLSGITPQALALDNAGFESDPNLDAGGSFDSGAVDGLTGWTVIARGNSSYPETRQVSLGSAQLNSADGTQALQLCAGAAVAQLTSLDWSQVNEGDLLRITIAAGDRATSANANPRWADESFIGLSNGLPSRLSAAPAAVGWLGNVVGQSPAIVSPPDGYKSGTMGDVVFTHTISGTEYLLQGKVGVFIASAGYRDGSQNGADAPSAQSFWDRVRVEHIKAPGPFIESFVSDKDEIVVGESITLSWSVNGADSVTLSGVGAVAASDSITLTPADDVQYTLTVGNANGSKSRSVSVAVKHPGPATYQYFRFTPTALRDPQSVTMQLAEIQLLRGSTPMVPASVRAYGDTRMNAVDGNLGTFWTLTDETDLVYMLIYNEPTMITGYRIATTPNSQDFDPVGWKLEGSADGFVWDLLDDVTGAVMPTRRQSWTQALTVNTNDTELAGAPEIDQFNASATSITEGESTTLSWSVSGATSVSISDLGAVATTGSTVVSPLKTTTYWLSAVNASGTRIASATVNVDSHPRGTLQASWDDAMFLTDSTGALVDSVATGDTFSVLDVGRLLVESDLRHIVIPFQLPDLGGGSFVSAELRVRVFGGELNLKGRTGIRVFAIPGSRDLSFIEPTDVVDGDANALTNGILVKNGFLNEATLLDTYVGSGESGAAATTLGHWLDQAYADGANAGRFVFLRLSPDVLQLPQGYGFGISSGDDAEANLPTLDYVFDPEPSVTPSIAYFDAYPAVIEAGSSATLQWGVRGSSGVTITPAVGAMSPVGTLTVSPVETTTYQLAIDGGATASVTVTVVPEGFYRHLRFIGLASRNPSAAGISISEVQFFSHGTPLTGAVATSAEGTPTRLVDGSYTSNWDAAAPAPFTFFSLDYGSFVQPTSCRIATNTNNIDRDPVGWRIQGSRDGITWVTLNEQLNGAYLIPTARSTVAADIYTVPGAPEIELSASAAQINLGESVTLNWSATEVSTVTINNGIGGKPASGSITVSPSSTTTYTVGATVDGFTVSRSVTILVFQGGLLASTYDMIPVDGTSGALLLSPISNLLAATPSASFTQRDPVDYTQTASTLVGGAKAWTSLPGITTTSYFTVLWQGVFDTRVEGTGDYTFGLNSYDGSVLYIDLNSDGDFDDAGELVIDKKVFGRGSNVMKTATVQLNHPVGHRIAIAFYLLFRGIEQDTVFSAHYKKGTNVAFADLARIEPGENPRFMASLVVPTPPEPQEHPLFRILAIRVDPNLSNVTLDWQSQPGWSYTIEASPSPSSPELWQPVQTGITSDGEITTETISAGTLSAAQFYRVKANSGGVNPQ
jgi:hypothetical protein